VIAPKNLTGLEDLSGLTTTLCRTTLFCTIDDIKEIRFLAKIGFLALASKSDF
jgi:hypothetical protein